MPEPTKGPWRASWSTEGQSWSILSEDGHMIANAFESETNAHRMATAPEMLEKLIELYIYLVDQVGESEGTDDLAALIAKARGE